METVTMTVRKVTEESVSKACADLTKLGLKPTVAAVRARIGGGSPNEIAPLVKKWKENQPKVAQTEITLDPAIAKLIAQQMAGYAADAVQSAEERAAEAEENVQSLTEAGLLLEIEVAQLRADLHACRSQVQQLTGQLAERAQEIEVVRSESRAAVHSSETKAANERAIAEGLRQDLVRAQIRAESLSGLENALADAQHQLKSANEALAGALKAAAVSDTRTIAAIERAQQAEAREAASRAEAAQLRDEAARGHASAQQLTAILAKVSADLAASVERKEAVKKAAEEITARLPLQNARAA
jgi:chromosome segregation ATPase